MGFFSKKWRCVKFDTKHRKNPGECRNCGHTVLQQVNKGSSKAQTEGSANRTRTVTPEPTPSKKWVCNHCKQEHDEEPSRCKVCGTEEFTVVGGEDSEPDNQTDSKEDTPTFSNIEEVREYEKENATDETESINYRWLTVKLVVFCIAVGVTLHFL